MMKTKLLILIAFTFLFAVSAFAQGGKAEPNRVSFAKGKSSATVKGKIYGDLEAEYVFAANEGQTVKLSITSIPKGKYSYFKVVNAEDYNDPISEYDINYSETFTAPRTGDYVFIVKFRPAGKVTSAKYSVTLSIK